VRGALDVRIESVGAVAGRLALPGWRRLGQPLAPEPLTATLDGRLTDLRFVEAFMPQLDSVAGSATLDARVGGTVGEPTVAGGLRVQDAAARVPLLGILLQDVQLAAQGDQAGALTIDGSMRSGPGTLALSGSTPVSPTFQQPGRLRIRGENFQAANTEETKALVSPSLDVTLIGDSTDIRGEIRIPFAHVELAQLPETAVSPSDDVVFVDDTAAQRAPQRFAADLRVVLGDSVSFDAFNFAAELGGEIHVVQLPEQPARGSGTIVIEEGRYAAYGQDLTVSQGLIRFAGGPVDNPALDIRAQRLAEDSVIAGLQIRGTVKQPEVTIFSEPAMSESRALEYIVLGHPRGQGSPSSGGLVSKAVSSLGLRGGNLIANTLGRGIGLDEARIESEGDVSQASFVAGSYLSPHLYVSYGVGLFDAINRLRLRYVISDN
jgi:translocation and assembly module TamB